MIKISDVNHSYGKKQVLKGVDITINKQDAIGIIGKNGAGKSTLVDIISGIKKPTKGNVEYDFPRKELYKRLGIQLQEAQFDDKLTVKDWCGFWAKMYDVPKERVNSLLDELELTEVKNNKFGKLSGGQKQKLNILFALLHDPELLIFDELTTGLDAPTRKDIRKKLKDLCDKGKTLLLVSHYMEELEQLCTKFIILKDGEIVENSTLEQLKSKYEATNLEECFDKIMNLEVSVGGVQ
jgi:ABC-2 type transport system ATP-binding protein